MTTAIPKVWTKDEIKTLLETSDKMVQRSLLKLYEYQTKDEQQAQYTMHHNNVGFNGFDSEFLSSVAEWILAGKQITPKQMSFTRKKMLKYSKQLATIANAQ